MAVFNLDSNLDLNFGEISLARFPLASVRGFGVTQRAEAGGACTKTIQKMCICNDDRLVYFDKDLILILDL